MATVRSVITGALRKLGVVGGTGRRTPTNTEFDDALRTVVSAYRGLITAGTFGRLEDITPTGNYVAGENQRVFRRYNDAQEFLLPDTVSRDGSCGYCGLDETIDRQTIPSGDYGRKRFGYNYYGDRRPIRDGAVVVLIDEISGDVLEAIYDGQRKIWITITDLDLEELDETNQYSVDRLNDALDQVAPLSHRDYNGLIAFMATLLADEYAAEISPMTNQQAILFKQSLTTNYSFYQKDDQCLI